MILADDLIERGGTQTIRQRTGRLVLQTSGAEKVGQAWTSIV
ncbi:MAG: hypothetical protein QM698_00460 [Micropepsaceae bacterium]